MNELSKYLCLLLRHQPEKAELDMDEHGWVSVEQLIDGVNSHSSYAKEKYDGSQECFYNLTFNVFDPDKKE